MCLYSEIRVFENVFCVKINIFIRVIKKIFIIIGTVSKDLKKCVRVIVFDYSFYLIVLKFCYL